MFRLIGALLDRPRPIGPIEFGMSATDGCRDSNPVVPRLNGPL